QQFSLSDSGEVLYQEKHGSPLPGVAIARIRKGDHILRPLLDVEETDLLNGSDRAAIIEKLKAWLDAHIAKVLEPLFILQNETPEAPLTGAVRGIAFQLHEALGILPRESLEDLIATLTPEDRAALRSRKVKLGPILVFLPELNKPAAVRLRAKLWAIWNSQPLPVEIPKDGAVSVKVEGVNHSLYQSIGYPVYGPRAIRIDMLDRVIVSIYDSAKDGKFQAVHQMAEWLGAPIDDLYAVLESMGHKRIPTPAPAVTEEVASAPEAPAEEPKAEEPKPEEAKPAPAEKPALDWFFLKRGKANQKAAPRVQGTAEKKKDFKPKDKPKSKGKPDRKPKDFGPKVISAAAKKIEDSPFAILGQLKNKG
ncbi:MAG TPA: helicase, partial [Alphaproteobacteria bacterium]|nr:helicase [Alphaproteobacteria bacterium]